MTLDHPKLGLANRITGVAQAIICVAFIIPYMIQQANKFLGWVSIALLFPLVLAISFSILPFFNYRRKYRQVRKLFIAMVAAVAVSAFVVYFAFSPYRIFLFFFFFVYLITIIRMEKDTIGWIILATNAFVLLAELRFLVFESDNKLFIPLPH